MTEAGFMKLLKDDGYIAWDHTLLTWEQVEGECARIDAKVSTLPSDARKIFKTLQLMKDKKIQLPSFVERRKEDVVQDGGGVQEESGTVAQDPGSGVPAG